MELQPRAQSASTNAISPSNLELSPTPRPSIDAQEAQAQPHNFSSLPPVDTGKSAWLCLAGCFIIESMVWGFPFSFGVFQDYYSTHEPFSSSPSGIAAIGTTEMGIMYLSGPFVVGALNYWPSMKRKFCFIGLAVLATSMVASSFANSVWELLLTQGVLYAIGGSMIYYPIMFFVDEWFVQRKGLAMGIMLAGTGFSGTSFPYLLSWALNTFSFQTALRMWAVVVVVVVLPFLYWTKTRVPYIPINSTTSNPRHHTRHIDLSFLKTRTFIIFNLCNTLEGLGYFIPSIFLPSYARSIGVTSGPTVTLTVALLNVSAVLGCIAVGLMVDRYDVTVAIGVQSMGALIAVFVFWGLTGLPGSNPLPMLLIFSIMYGFFAGSWTTQYSGIIREVQQIGRSQTSSRNGAEEGRRWDSGMIIGFLSMGRGIGSVCAGPISEALLGTKSSDSGAVKYDGSHQIGYQGDYRSLIILTGATAGMGGLSWAARRLGWI